MPDFIKIVAAEIIEKLSLSLFIIKYYLMMDLIKIIY